MELEKIKGALTHSVDQATGLILQQPQADCPVTHTFGPGTYTRELHMKAGTFAIGHIQKFHHLNVFVKGKVAMLQKDGTVKVLSAPMTFIGEPGQKVGLVLEDVVWLNVYATNLTDINEIEDYIFDKAEGAKMLEYAQEKIKNTSNEIDRMSFRETIGDLGFTEEQVYEMSRRTDDMMNLPHGGYKIKVGISPIQGEGLFATSFIKAGETIAPARLGNKRTIAGRYTNHAFTPNAVMKRMSGNMYLVATKDIQGCKGGLDGDEITIDYGQSYRENRLALQEV